MSFHFQVHLTGMLSLTDWKRMMHNEKQDVELLSDDLLGSEFKRIMLADRSKRLQLQVPVFIPRQRVFTRYFSRGRNLDHIGPQRLPVDLILEADRQQRKVRLVIER